MKRNLGGGGAVAFCVTLVVTGAGASCKSSDSGSAGGGPEAGGPGDASFGMDSASPQADGSPQVDTGGGADVVSNGDGAAGTVLRTLVYHQASVETGSGVDSSKGLAFSRDGTRAVFVVDGSGGGYDVTVIGADGSGRKVLETVMAGWIQSLAISGDGSLVTYSGPSGELRVASTDGTTIAPKDLVPFAVNSPRFAHDPANASGWRVYFSLPTDFGGPPAAPRGVYSVKPDGTGLTPLLSASDVATLASASATLVAPGANDLEAVFDVSSDGTHFVSSWGSGGNAASPAWIVGATSDGATKRVLTGPITSSGPAVDKVAISGDGTIVATTTFDASANPQLGTVHFDGTGMQALGADTRDPAGGWGLSDDGKKLLANYALYDTGGAGAFDVAVRGAFTSSDPTSAIDAYLGRLDGAGTRVLYLVENAKPVYVATLDLNPSSAGAAPTIGDPSIVPSTIAAGSQTATVSATVASTQPPYRVGSALLLEGQEDTDSCVLGAQVMQTDDAGDGIYSSAQVAADTCVMTKGARTVRVVAKVQSADGKQHATAIDFGPFSIE